MYLHTHIFFTEESEQLLRMILLIPVKVMNCENCQLCYQPVKADDYVLPTHTDHNALRK